MTDAERYAQFLKNRASTEHPAAAGDRVRSGGRMVELWARMPLMSFMPDNHQDAQVTQRRAEGRPKVDNWP